MIDIDGSLGEGGGQILDIDTEVTGTRGGPGTVRIMPAVVRLHKEEVKS